MRIRKLNVMSLVTDDAKYQEYVCFIKLPYCKLYRVVSIPEEQRFNDELVEVLNTLCIRFNERYGVFFFKLDEDAVRDVGETLFFMGINSMFIHPEMIVHPIDPQLN